MDPDRLGGFGAQPGANPQTQTSNITANSPWDQRLVVYFTPYGFLRLAEGREATVEARTVDGIRYNVLSFSVEDGEETRQLEGYFDTDDVLRKIETRLDDPVMGDMRVEVEFDDYQDVNGVLFPMHVLESRGELAYKELTIDSVVPNAVIEEPEQAAGGGGRGGGGRGAGGGGRGGGGGGRGAGGGGAPAAEVELSTRIGEGIWVVDGGYQSVIVEFPAYSAVIEGAQNAARSRQLIAEAKRVTGEKPIRYYVTTHSHFDHISGIRDFVAEGATIVSPDLDVAFYERVLNTPHTINPDLAQEVGATATVQGMGGDLYVIEDGVQRIELHQLHGSAHAADMAIAYLPSIRTIVESDLLQPWMNAQFGGPGHPFLVYLKGELDRLALDYEAFIPIHRPTPPPTVSRAEFEALVTGD
jgi:glyoxylase-like metal-dependent hydrolase (beta-lactamase superfamily II)